MSNRFNKPDMLKANRQRYIDTRRSNESLIAAKRFVESGEEARSIREARKVAKQLKPGAVVRYRIDRRPWHERFVEWVTGC